MSLPRLIRVVVPAAVAVFVVLSMSPTASEAGPARPGGKLVPDWGAYWGVTVDGQGAGPGTGLRRLEHRVGRKFDLVDHYYGWQNAFPTQTERDMVHAGRIPMISWKGVSLAPIIQGQYDGLIHRRARALRRFGHWVFLRWGWEMNGEWEPWSGAQNNPNGPAKYVRAWRHIRQIFWDENAWNVVFVWTPNSGDTPHAKWNHYTHYYPGDAYVDWVGVDGFNWGATQWWSNWRPLADVVAGVYHAYANRKPIMVAETGCVEQGGSKARWFQKARTVLHQRFPALAAVIYYNAADDEGAVWKVTTSSSSLSSYRRWGQDPYWNP